MIFDEPVDRARLQQFASQVEYLPDTLLQDFARNFEKGQSADFYRGLLSAYANAYAIIHNSSPESQEDQIMGSLVAYLSNEIIQNEWYG